MSKELELIAEVLRDVATEGHEGAPGARDDGQLWGAFPNTMNVHDLAAHVVSRLSEHGYSIVLRPKPSVNGADNAVWQTPSHYIEREYSGDVTIDDRFAISAHELAEVGEALLAAAAAAEEDQ